MHRSKAEPTSLDPARPIATQLDDPFFTQRRKFFGAHAEP
jgi:hypothetical protein